MQNVIDKINELIISSKLSVRQFEIQIGLSISSISAWRTGKANPSAKALKKIADYFNLPISYFYEDHEEIKKALPQINEVTLSQEEQELFNLILSLTDEEVQELSSFVDYIISKRSK